MLKDNEDDIHAVAARLKRVREVLGMSKQQFASGADLSKQVYGVFENANRELTLSAAKKLRKAYGLPLEFIFFGIIDDLPHKIAVAL